MKYCFNQNPILRIEAPGDCVSKWVELTGAKRVLHEGLFRGIVSPCEIEVKHLVACDTTPVVFPARFFETLLRMTSYLPDRKICLMVSRSMPRVKPASTVVRNALTIGVPLASDYSVGLKL